jgi:hypothetical protein
VVRVVAELAIPADHLPADLEHLVKGLRAELAQAGLHMAAVAVEARLLLA